MPSPTVPTIRNLAIIAHVDHGKTTLVDALLKQGQAFAPHQNVGDLIMDSNPLERERGITIMAKNTAVTYQGVKINIIDTPGHADFSGEIERTINMADGCLLLVDAVEGPMPQTRFVLQQALRQRLAPLVVINKIDRPQARIPEVVNLVQDLFLELADDADQLDFPILYASGRHGYAVADLSHDPADMQPLFRAIIDHVPPPAGDPTGPLQLLVTALDYDNYLGSIGIGRVFRGAVLPRSPVARISADGETYECQLDKVFVFHGLDRHEVPSAPAGEIAAVTGIPNLNIGDTITAPDCAQALPLINVAEPTVKMTFGVNTSPFMGRDGAYCTSRSLHSRLLRELRTNVGLRVESTHLPDEFLVSGRGELHLSILVETMRREGYEFQVSKPEPITRRIDGILQEPCESLTIDTREEFIGPLTENLSGRLARLVNITHAGDGGVRLEFHIPTRGLIGFRSFFLKTTRGHGVANSQPAAYQPMTGEVKPEPGGVLVASQAGAAVTYGLLNAQGRGSTFVEPGAPVYQGMIVGMHPREGDIPINVCREKKLTNMRSSTADIAKRLSPVVSLSLEEALDFIAPDELVEVTPAAIRLRKKQLSPTDRAKTRR